MVVMDIQAVLEQARQIHRLVLTDAVSVSRRGVPTRDGWGTPTYPVTIPYMGPGLMQIEKNVSSVIDSAGVVSQSTRYSVKVPISQYELEAGTFTGAPEGITVGDLITVTSGLGVAGVTVRVDTVEINAWAIIRRLRCTRVFEVAGGPEGG